MNADALLVLSYMGCQSAESAFSPCAADSCVVVRLVGATPRGNSGSRRELARRARAGYCRRCTSATYAALPPPFALKNNNDVKAKRVALWKDFGPRAQGRQDALPNAKPYVSLPPVSDWEAGSSTMDIPGPFMRAPLDEEGLNLHSPQSKPKPPSTFR